MGLELDTLKNNDTECVIYNNTNGSMVGGFYDIKSFKQAIYSQWDIPYCDIKNYFTFDEVADFFDGNSIEYNEEELKELFTT